MCGHQQLPQGAPQAACGLQDQANVSLLLRLRGGAGASKLQLTVQPRVQKEKWSLYWKESMSTKTISLDPVQLDVDDNTTIAEVAAADMLCRFVTGCVVNNAQLSTLPAAGQEAASGPCAGHAHRCSSWWPSAASGSQWSRCSVWRGLLRRGSACCIAE